MTLIENLYYFTAALCSALLAIAVLIIYLPFLFGAIFLANWRSSSSDARFIDMCRRVRK
jgi:hypothetical protein